MADGGRSAGRAATTSSSPGKTRAEPLGLAVLQINPHSSSQLRFENRPGRTGIQHRKNGASQAFYLDSDVDQRFGANPQGSGIVKPSDARRERLATQAQQGDEVT